MSSASREVAAIKTRVQTQQNLIPTEPYDRYVNLSRRAEFDALWAAIEVIAQVVDGVNIDDVTVRDYFAELLRDHPEWRDGR